MLNCLFQGTVQSVGFLNGLEHNEPEGPAPITLSCSPTATQAMLKDKVHFPSIVFPKLSFLLTASISLSLPASQSVTTFMPHLSPQ